MEVSSGLVPAEGSEGESSMPPSSLVSGDLLAIFGL